MSEDAGVLPTYSFHMLTEKRIIFLVERKPSLEDQIAQFPKAL